MNAVSKVVAVLAVVSMMGGALAWAHPEVGSVVPDSVAAELHGGCAGSGTNSCSGIDLPCNLICVGNGPNEDEDPGSVVEYWCAGMVDGERVCLSCAAFAVGCSY